MPCVGGCVCVGGGCSFVFSLPFLLTVKKRNILIFLVLLHTK